MILTRSTRLVQPLGPVELDTSNPLTRGVVVAWVPGSSRNIADGTPASVGGVRKVGPDGYIQATTGAQKAFLVPDAPSQRTPTFTSYAILRRVGSLASNFDVIGKNWQSNAGNTFVSDRVAYNRNVAGQNAIAAVFGRDGGLDTTAVYSGQDTSNWHSVASTHNGSTGSLYVGGALRSTVAVKPVVYGSSGDNSFGTNFTGKTGQMEYALVLRWNRALSASEIARLESNPWQLFRPVQRRVYFDMGAGGSATTQVSNDLTGEYAIRSAVQSDSSGSYSVRAAVQADASSAYTVLGAASADAAADYTIRASAQADLSASFTVRGSVQADASSSFTVRGSTQSDAPATYLLRGSVSSDIVGTYDILNANSVSSSLAASYVVRGAVQSDVSGSCDLRTSVGAASPHAFMVRGLVSSDLASSYEVQAAAIPVYADLAGSYAVDGITPDFTRSIYWAAVPAEKFSAAVASKTFTASVPSEKFSAAVSGGNQ